MAAATISERPKTNEEVYMNPADGLVHGVFAPGRHLVTPVRIRGARCEPPVWGKGHRLPQYLTRRHYLLCRREGLDAVEIEVETKWGVCRQEIAGGDATPRCREWFGRPSDGLRRLSQKPCA